MRKEVLLSIVIGFAVGLAATFGIYQANKSVKNAQQIQSPVAQTIAEEVTDTPVSPSLSLAAPLDQSVTNEKKTLLSGLASSEIPLIILYETGEKIIMSDKKGNFETEIPLDSGENEIEVKAFFENGEIQTKKITVVYTTAEI